jgi:hypothetical protein
MMPIALPPRDSNLQSHETNDYGQGPSRSRARVASFRPQPTRVLLGQEDLGANPPFVARPPSVCDRRPFTATLKVGPLEIPLEAQGKAVPPCEIENVCQESQFDCLGAALERTPPPCNRLRCSEPSTQHVVEGTARRRRRDDFFGARGLCDKESTMPRKAAGQIFSGRFQQEALNLPRRSAFSSRRSSVSAVVPTREAR